MKLDRLDALRGFAAVYVVLFHSFSDGLNIGHYDIGIIFRFSQEAVIIFFLVSGFVINYSYRNSVDGSFKTYFIKRATRIYAPLLVVMLLGWIIECFKAQSVADIRLKELVLNLLMLQDLDYVKPNVIVPPYMGNDTLWSLSYEWWYYMLYFPIQKWFATSKARDIFVYLLSMVCAIVYLYAPLFVPRVLMYMSIWWLGVSLSNLYIDQGKIRFSQLLLPLTALTFVSIINLYSVIIAQKAGQNLSMGIHPFLEFRHHVVALAYVLGALLWHSVNWYGFKVIFNPFTKVAPISYAIYISHYYMVSKASYLSMIDGIVVRFILYCIPMIPFCYVIEQLLYPWVRKQLLLMATVSSPKRDRS